MTDSTVSQTSDSKWTNLEPEKLIRGQTIDGVNQRCLDLCRAYIGGSWLGAQSTDDVTVTRITGGFTNQLYRVALKDTVPRVDNQVYAEEPVEVAIKLYQEKHLKNYVRELQNGGEGDERLNDTIVLPIVSHTGLGPKVYGIFNGGFIQAYHQHEQFRAKQQADQKLVEKVATLAASINHLSVPINKTPNLLFAELRRLIHHAFDTLPIAELIERLHLKTLKSNDLRAEFDALGSLIARLNIPTVLCHNDFRGSNLMVLNVNVDTADESTVLAIDFEYCGYGWRGYDLATVLFEWGKTDFFDFSDRMPSDAELRPVVQSYIAACDRIVPGYAAKAGNSLEEHLREVKLMFLTIYMFLMGVMIGQTESVILALPFDVNRKMFTLEQFYSFYFAIKATLEKDGTIRG